MLKSLLKNTEYDVNSNIKVDSCSVCEDSKQKIKSKAKKIRGNER